MNGYLLLQLFTVVLTQGKDTSGIERELMQEALSHQVIETDQPWQEVQEYCASLVLPMPRVKTEREWETFASKTREEVLEKIIFVGEAVLWQNAPLQVEWLDVLEEGHGYRIKKLRYEALPGLWIPALLYEPENLEGKVPAILNVNGHDPEGKAADYKQIRCINQAKRGMLALNTEWVGMGQLRRKGFSHYRMNQLDLCGTSGQAVFFLNAQRGLDVLWSLEHTDRKRVAVTGLSGGGCQTIQLSALDTRVQLANPVAGYSSFITRVQHTKDLGDSEQTPRDLATLADYTHLTAMMAPRHILLTYNAKDDCCFESGYALPPLVEAAQPIFDLFGSGSHLQTHINENPGTHNYLLDNREAFYQMIGNAFFAKDQTFDPKEIPCKDEIKDAKALEVSLPESNQDFHSLAVQLMEELPRGISFPNTTEDLIPWQDYWRRELADLTRYKTLGVETQQVDATEICGVQVFHQKLVMDGSWTVPATELVPEEWQNLVVLVSDQGRAKAGKQVQDLLSKQLRVLVIDPFYLGESKISQRDFLYALALSCVGDRPLGLQASQIAAACQWLKSLHPKRRLKLFGLGHRSSLACLTAGALERDSIDSLELHHSLGSLKEVIERDWSAQEEPTLFCFGLLEHFDLSHLACLVAPRALRFYGNKKRLEKELDPVRTVHQNLVILD